jgi:transcriptional regulator with XRE-family HTH domain
VLPISPRWLMLPCQSPASAGRTRSERRVPDGLTGKECKTARTLLGWQMRDLWARSQVSIDSISRLERGEGGPRPRTCAIYAQHLKLPGSHSQMAGRPDCERKIRTETLPHEATL